MNKLQEVIEKGKTMSDGFVILGTVSIVGIVAVLTVALVYNRPLWLRGSRESLEVHTTPNDKISNRTEDHLDVSGE